MLFSLINIGKYFLYVNHSKIWEVIWRFEALSPIKK